MSTPSVPSPPTAASDTARAGFVPAAEAPTGEWDGAGVFSSASDLHEAWSADPDPLALTSSAVGFGLDALRFLADPFGEGAQAGVGWLLEHVGFLRELLDDLAGDPAQIVARSTDWRTGAATLRAEAAAVARATPGPGVWSGAAGDAARAGTAGQAVALDALAVNCGEVADLLVRTGAMIGVERSLVRDAIAEFVVWLIRWLAATLVATLLTAGAAMAAMVPATVIEATSLAARLLDRLVQVADLTRELARRAGDIAADIERFTEQWGVPAARRVLEPFTSAGVNRATHLGLDAVVESGKETAKAAAAAGRVS